MRLQVDGLDSNRSRGRPDDADVALPRRAEYAVPEPTDRRPMSHEPGHRGNERCLAGSAVALAHRLPYPTRVISTCRMQPLKRSSQ